MDNAATTSLPELLNVEADIDRELIGAEQNYWYDTIIYVLMHTENRIELTRFITPPTITDLVAVQQSRI